MFLPRQRLGSLGRRRNGSCLDRNLWLHSLHSVRSCLFNRAEFNKRGFSANGSTWYDRTNDYASFSANDANLRWYLNWQADAMGNATGVD